MLWSLSYSLVGEKVTMDQVLLIGTPTQTKLGGPLVEGAYVETVVEQQTLSDKVHVSLYIILYLFRI